MIFFSTQSECFFSGTNGGQVMSPFLSCLPGLRIHRKTCCIPFFLRLFPLRLLRTLPSFLRTTRDWSPLGEGNRRSTMRNFAAPIVVRSGMLVVFPVSVSLSLFFLVLLTQCGDLLFPFDRPRPFAYDKRLLLFSESLRALVFAPLASVEDSSLAEQSDLPFPTALGVA